MFKMNPSAKEFVPAHILKQRQEEADRLKELTDQLDNVNINKNDGSNRGETSKMNGEDEKRSKPNEVDKEEEKPVSTAAQENATTNKPQTQDEGKRLDSNDKNSTTSTSNSQQNNHSNQNNAQNNISTANFNNNNNNNNQQEGDYPEGWQDLIDEEDERFLLNEGENICEFNGEQFIIPGDNECVPANRAGYDFGNAEDNEDEDVCNAFEEFLDNLPGQ